MVEPKEEKISKFNDKDDESFHLWRLRIEAVFENRECMSIVNGSETLADDASDVTVTEYEKRKKKATALMVLALGDKPLKVVQKHSKDPAEMWKKLTARYAGKSTSNKLTLLNEVFSKTYESGESMTDHIGYLELGFTKLDNAGQAINELMQVSILLSSIKECEEYGPTIAAIRTMDEEKATWETVTTRLIDEYKERSIPNEKSNKNTVLAANAVTPKKCYRCGRIGHIAAQCDRKRKFVGRRNHYRRFNQVNRIQENFDKPRVAIANVPTSNMSSVTNHIEKSSPEERCPNEIQLGDKTTVKSEYKGTVDLVSNTTGKWIRLSNVLYAPSMAMNLISVPYLDARRINLTFVAGQCELIDADNNDVMARAKLIKGGLYVLDASVITKTVTSPVANPASMIVTPKVQFHDEVAIIKDKNGSRTNVWHSRLGHVGENKVLEMMKSNNINGMKSVDRLDTIKCKPCTMGKQAKDSHKGSLTNNCDSVGDIIFADVCGPMPVASWGHAKYLLLFIDCKSRYVWIYTLKKKSDVFNKTKSFIRVFNVIYERNIKVFHTDNGGEFVNNRMDKMFNDEGITHSRTAAYNPESNGIVERMNRTILDRIRCMLLEAKLDDRFWGEAALHAADIVNVLPRRVLEAKTPFELINERKPDLSNLRTFGCEILVTTTRQRRKLDHKAQQMLYMGNVGNFLYRVFNPVTKHIEHVRHVRFNEDVFPGYPKCSTQQQNNSSEYVVIGIDEESHDVPSQATARNIDETGDDDDDTPEEPGIIELNLADGQNTDDVSRAGRDEMHPIALRRSTRVRRPNQRYLAITAKKVSQARIPDEPTFTESMNSQVRDEWINAVNKELTVLRDRGTWSLVPRPEGANVLPNKFVFKIKRHPDGTIDKYKARLVVLGCNQKEEDFGQVYSRVLDFTSVRVALALAGIDGAYVHQMDVASAFLHGELEENVYMQQPRGFEDKEHPGFVCKLNKTLYGLKQAPRVWYFHFSTRLSRKGFKKLDHAESAWSLSRKGEKLLLLSYVDDILLITKSMRLMHDVKKELMQEFKVNDLGQVTEFLGVKVGRDDQGAFYLSQKGYIEKILKLFDLEHCKGVSTPMDPGSYKELTEKTVLSEAEAREMTDMKYREAIDGLLYLSTRTRPDISVAVNTLSRHVAQLRPIHWRAVKRVLRYLQGTKNLVMKLDANNSTLSAYADSDWGGAADRSSTSGYVVMLGGVPVVCKSAKQSCIALSSTEAEYLSLSSAVREVSWLRSLLKDFGFPQPEGTNIYQDNSGAVSWVTDISNFKRNKHIDIRLHYVRDLVAHGHIVVEPVNTKDMIADCLTKPLFGPKLRSGIANFRMVNINPNGSATGALDQDQ